MARVYDFHHYILSTLWFTCQLLWKYFRHLKDKNISIMKLVVNLAIKTINKLVYCILELLFGSNYFKDNIYSTYKSLISMNIIIIIIIMIFSITIIVVVVKMPFGRVIVGLKTIKWCMFILKKLDMLYLMFISAHMVLKEKFGLIKSWISLWKS